MEKAEKHFKNSNQAGVAHIFHRVLGFSLRPLPVIASASLPLFRLSLTGLRPSENPLIHAEKLGLTCLVAGDKRAFGCLPEQPRVRTLPARCFSCRHTPPFHYGLTSIALALQFVLYQNFTHTLPCLPREILFGHLTKKERTIKEK